MDKILIINTFGIGDVLFTTPVISNLRRAYPDAHIAYIGNRRTSEFLRLNPKISQVFVYERDEFYAVYKRNPAAFLKKWADFINDIGKQRFDVVFDFSLNSTFGFVCWFAGIPRRIGYDYRGRGRFLTHKLPLDGYEGRHVVEYYLDLLKWQGIEVIDRQMEMPIGPKEQQWACDWLGKHGLAGKVLVALVPGGGASWGNAAKYKRWPPEKYAQLVDKIVADWGAAVILMGDAGEKQLSREVARLAHFPVYSALGETSLVQMAALLKQCRLAVVNDGGPLHVAVASKVKTVSIFGPVDPRVYGPYPPEGQHIVQKRMPCQPCYNRFRMAACEHISCLRDLTLDEVVKKISL